MALPLSGKVGSSLLLAGPSDVCAQRPKTLWFEQVLKAGESQNILFFLGHELFAVGNICTG